MIVRGYEGKQPKLGERVFIADTAAVIGDVHLGDPMVAGLNSLLRFTDQCMCPAVTFGGKLVR